MGIILDLFPGRQDDDEEPTSRDRHIASLEAVIKANDALIELYESAFEDLHRLADQWRALSLALDQDETQGYSHCATTLRRALPTRAAITCRT
jgi:hypothetical protein